MVSEFFIPIYESNFEKFEDAKSISPIQKQANLIFCEREFISWLRNKFGNKLTNKTYPNYCTQKYFELFIPDFVILKKKKVYILKKEAILQQLISDLKFPTIKKHEYDIDIVETYFKLKKLFETLFTDEEQKAKKLYLDSFFYPIQFYCSENEMSLDRVLQLKYPIIINNTTFNFEAFLGRYLIVCDLNKVAAILSYQDAKWNRDMLFATFVEHSVFNFVSNNCPFELKERLAKIMDWADKNRIFITVETTKEEKELIVNNGQTKVQPIELHYWTYQEEKLRTFYDLLVNEGKIEKTDFFYENFKTNVDLPKNPIVWKTSTIELMYLLGLIFKQQARYKSISVHDIALKLFKSNKKEFTSKGLNTTYLEAKLYYLKGAKLSTGIKSIKKIFDDLELY